ncbi:hypothetical protein PTI98_007345 [Pleurotus ostreatus]|nr:hypothetical protein PTI98_007345 [Pleurotus ostreatus]
MHEHLAQRKSKLRKRSKGPQNDFNIHNRQSTHARNSFYCRSIQMTSCARLPNVNPVLEPYIWASFVP